jgi:hypothetical protein
MHPLKTDQNIRHGVFEIVLMTIQCTVMCCIGFGMIKAAEWFWHLPMVIGLGASLIIKSTILFMGYAIAASGCIQLMLVILKTGIDMLRRKLKIGSQARFVA